MNLRQLSIFCAVCEEMSFTRAAKRLYMTQPAVSHVIAGLERETGCVLFDRISRGIHLTGAGRAFYEKAARIVELMGDLERKMCIRDRYYDLSHRAAGGRLPYCAHAAVLHVDTWQAEGNRHSARAGRT